MKLNSICYITRKVTALAGFYAGILGVQAVGDAQHMDLNTEGIHISIFSVEAMEKLAPSSTQGCGPGSMVAEFEVQEIEGEYELLKAMGVELVKPLQSHPWGARSFWFRDPDGNIVDFFAKTEQS